VSLRLHVEGIARSFNRRSIFSDISFTLEAGQTLLIAGRNGSGKSTLVKILCGVLSSSRGSVHIAGAGEGDHRNAFGVVSPYLQVYDEFSAKENLEIAMHIRGLRADSAALACLLARVALPAERTDPVRTFSSGMKQRVKYALALAHQPAILMLDEPMANLDDEGIRIVRALMEEHRRNGILIVATNDLTDVPQFDAKVDLNARV
jgi:heme exporter protein A